MFTTVSEQSFLFYHLKPFHKVLEYGCGKSTVEIAEKCNHIVSIEHQLHWYNIINKNKPNNCDLILAPPDLLYKEGISCGTYEEFKTYIEAPLSYAPFDIIFIDGRARVGCASICHKLAHFNSIIFIHDYTRSEYNDIKNYLKLIDSCEQMARYALL
jgi:hypothetical protein